PDKEAIRERSAPIARPCPRSFPSSSSERRIVLSPSLHRPILARSVLKGTAFLQTVRGRTAIATRHPGTLPTPYRRLLDLQKTCALRWPCSEVSRPEKDSRKPVSCGWPRGKTASPISLSCQRLLPRNALSTTPTNRRSLRRLWRTNPDPLQRT